ncbi:MAG TPA: CPBP family intramembrane glutamic endopeptidase [Thermodesulfovibrionales bacterium]|nr:CPBP family intramembrane glutamic endopeptidase [Thermodesulfovibrionales bacterium]
MFAYHASSLSLFKYLIPLFLLTIPYFLQGEINFRSSLRDGATGIVVSFILLLPLFFFFVHSGKVFALLTSSALLFQLFGISLPEEAYFRGFLQQGLGNTVKGVFVVSILFALTHLPRFIFHGDLYSLLTFFPSLVMGLLYYRTSNILPSTIFHFLSNIVFLGFCDIL